jgi:hypothetical protein
MVDKSVDSWQLDDWNRALFQHYFAEATEPTPVTRLAVTSEELGKAIENVVGPDEARKSLINVLRRTLEHRSLGSDAKKGQSSGSRPLTQFHRFLRTFSSRAW